MATDRAARLRAAYRRRGPVEARLAGNRGQQAIVAERDAVVLALVTAAGRPGALLDLGCGEGRFLATVAKELGLDRPVGIDLLPERIDRARASWPGIDFRVADATALPFEDETFDAVLSLTVFSSLPRTIRTLVAREIARVLRPGGSFVWYDMRRPSPRNRDVRPFGHHDVATLFPGWTVTSRTVTLAPPLARRLGRSTPLTYPILARLPVLRTHEAGSARRPNRSAHA